MAMQTQPRPNIAFRAVRLAMRLGRRDRLAQMGHHLAGTA